MAKVLGTFKVNQTERVECPYCGMDIEVDAEVTFEEVGPVKDAQLEFGITKASAICPICRNNILEEWND